MAPKFKPKDRVMTNPAFSKIFEGGAMWRGTIVAVRELEKKVQYKVKVDDDNLVSAVYIAEKWLKKEAKV